jgi:hypothetical protein
MTDQTAPHSCPNCEGIDPDSCLFNPDRPKRATDEAERRDRYAKALAEITVGHRAFITVDVKAEYKRADAVMAVADTEQAELRARIRFLGELAARRESELIHYRKQPPAAVPAVDRGAILCDAADMAYRRARQLDAQQHDERAQGAWDVENSLRSAARIAAGVQQAEETDELRRMADGEQQTETSSKER